ncbi:hypothetical protein [Candidatus Methanocrinis natronophilus]|uniref:Uncharacterized protein n=1 Tax=Candidatus Methanocrinis natronophilus TaxID=3033396 RepID=A0ABT5X9X8_9EURY|nr:hypothetical protein [Candidatus Methanocrinis natronophilus]MDF0591510.1 hypothetical protein [Candidatus Methanocrinis natronophilus]
MRRFLILLAFSAILGVVADGAMERGTKSDSLEDVILVEGGDWRGVIAATPLVGGWRRRDQAAARHAKGG